MYGDRCEYCEGTVRERLLKRHAFSHVRGFVILENVIVGECDHCFSHYLSAALLHHVHDIATGRLRPERVEKVPVASGEIVNEALQRPEDATKARKATRPRGRAPSRRGKTRKTA